ncbi:unnamed protein product [Alopecurus aequalis]
METLRLPAAKESESQCAVQAVTVVVTVPFDDARSVAIRLHRAREKTGMPPADGADGVAAQPAGHKITDQPGTMTYHALVCGDRAAGLVDVRGIDAGPLSCAGPSTGHAGTTVRRAVGSAHGSRGKASIEAQIMADNPVIHYDAADYHGCPRVQRLLRRAGSTLAAAALWVAGICSPRDPDVRCRCGGPLKVCSRRD